MDCDFCTEFAGAGQGDRIIVEDMGWVLLPTLGCFVPGYCLFMPVDHVDAAADLHAGDLARLDFAVEEMRARVESEFGPTIVAEHGSRDCQLGAGCCTHCHLHLIPVPDPYAVVDAYEEIGGPGRILSDLPDLPGATGGPYLLLSPRPGQHLVWPADRRFPRQHVRRVCARLHGVADRYDWRDHPFRGNQAMTADILRAAVTQSTA
jgi:diadenosine tetraphosphate (Ap4A) HIT family hydrolase